MRAALCESTITVRSVSMPLLLGPTRNRGQPGGASPALPARARCDDQEVGCVTVDHERLGAVELKAVAGSHGLELGL